MGMWIFGPIISLGGLIYLSIDLCITQTAKKYSIPSRIISRAKELSAAFDDICRGIKDSKHGTDSNDVNDIEVSKGSDDSEKADDGPRGALVFGEVPPPPLEMEGGVVAAAAAAATGTTAAAAGAGAAAAVAIAEIVSRDSDDGRGGGDGGGVGGAVEGERGWWPSDGEGWGGSSSAGGFRTMADAAQVTETGRGVWPRVVCRRSSVLCF